MKKTIVFFSFLFSSLYCFSQSNNARIAEIKKMYADIVNLYKTVNHKNCKKGVSTLYEGFSQESEQMPFEQNAEYCKMGNGYSLYMGTLRGYDWQSDCRFYMKENKIFFALIISGDEICADEYRLYYDSNGSMIKILQNTNGCDPSVVNLKSSEIKEAQERKKVEIDANDQLAKILKILN